MNLDKLRSLKAKISSKYQELKVTFLFAVSATILKIKDLVGQYIVKPIKYAGFMAANFTLRHIGTALKLPVYVLNNIAIIGNILQMRANALKARAKSLYIPDDM